MPVSTQHPLYLQAADRSRTVRDAVKGAYAIKAAKSRYLPIPNREDYHSVDPATAQQAISDYEDYLLRAQFLGVTGLTLQGFLGAIFRKEPQFECPVAIDYAREDMDGRGTSLSQFSKQICAEAAQSPFVGILVDYPDAPTGITEAQRQAINARATAKIYPVESVINYQTKTIGARTFLHRVVLLENIEVEDLADRFTIKQESQYRVLELIGGVYHQSLYDNSLRPVFDPRPILANGRPMTAIPFHVIGSQSNSIDYTQKPLLEDIADVNISLYRNSADYEENLFIHGRSTLFLTSDIAPESFKEANPNGIRIGSRTGHFLGPSGSATLVQADAATALEIAIANKLEDMQRLGAQLITPQGSNETAEAARIRASSESSQLETLVDNASEGIEDALESMALFMGADPNQVSFDLNDELFPSVLSAQDVVELRNLYADGLISREQVWRKLRKAGWIDSEITDDELDQEIGDVIGEEMTQNP